MLNENELKYLETEIKKTIRSVEHEHFNYIMGERSDMEVYYQGFTNIWLTSRLRDLYYTLLAYFEGKDMIYVMKRFEDEFKEVIKNPTQLVQDAVTHPEGEPELVFITQAKRYLEAFKFYDYTKTVIDEQEKLISILKNSGYIIKNSRAKIKNEADIYKEVKWVIGLYYPSCRKINKARFIEQFRSYSPDILIPELKTAIEYKYIHKKENNIDEFIDQIRIDAGNYVDDPDYDKFIAVIYIEDISLATPESIEIAWKFKKFPPNWKLILTINSATIN